MFGPNWYGASGLHWDSNRKRPAASKFDNLHVWLLFVQHMREIQLCECIWIIQLYVGTWMHLPGRGGGHHRGIGRAILLPYGTIINTCFVNIDTCFVDYYV